MARVVTIGTFDIPHLGHAEFLKKAVAWTQWPQSDFIIGVNSDRFVLRYKGASPLYNQYERQSFIKSLGYHRVEFNDGPGLEFIKRCRANIVVVGSDWLERGGYMEQIGLSQREMVALGLSIIFVPYTQGISTSDIKRRIEANA